MRTIIYPYKMASESGGLLSDGLNALRVRADGLYTPRTDDFIINWGSSTIPIWYNRMESLSSMILNKPEAVSIAVNKLQALDALSEYGVATPAYVTQRMDAVEWLEDGDVVYERHKLTGHSGNGIRVVMPSMELLPAPLYVLGINGQAEYRVHVVCGEVIDYIKKRRRVDDTPNAEQEQVRNLDNGWVYSRQNLRRLDRVEEIAKQAIEALELDFGAVDVIMDDNGDVFVLEVNTACGMSDTTMNAYLESFNNLIDEHARNYE